MIPPSQRIYSLDVFRGLTMACMIVVNNPGSWSYVYPPLQHAEWHGWTPTDMVFPFFLFAVGVAIKLSMDKYLQTAARRQMFARIVRRTLILFAVGLFLNGTFEFDLSTWRIPGVLQRIAMCYFFASLLYIAVSNRRDGNVVTRVAPIAWTFAGLLVLYFVLMTFVPVPGCGAGQLSSPEGNLAGYIDRHVFGEHVWEEAKTWDPEGILSTLPAIATVLSGVLCGWWLRSNDNRTHVFRGLLIAGVIGVALAYLVNPVFPINKKIWTSSYVLLSSGLAMIVLGLIYYYADIKGKRTGTTPFVIFGSNAITAYVLSSFFGNLFSTITFSAGGTPFSIKSYVYAVLLKPVFGNDLASLMFALLFVALWLGVISILYKKRIFIKV